MVLTLGSRVRSSRGPDAAEVISEAARIGREAPLSDHHVPLQQARWHRVLALLHKPAR
jgi:hypothetical protein